MTYKIIIIIQYITMFWTCAGNRIIYIYIYIYNFYFILLYYNFIIIIL